MIALKCKMCGGNLHFTDGESTVECEYCGSVQTVPKVDDEKKLVLFERAERLRRMCEFDKAAGIFEAIVADFRQEAEAYWGLVLCKYGIEYVDDPSTNKKIPTCHRSSFDSIMEDSDFEQALECADSTARMVYRKEAKQIEEIRKGIIAVSANEEPYDIFICYKETDEKGERTLDSVLAQDVYEALTAKGYRVFFSRISLEDKLGVEYEPFIFAALNSAKIMLSFGTDYEYFNAVWVKNEWSRFLKLMTKDKEKHLIPCYKGIDAYDMPKEFAKLQAQDMGKVGAMQDLLRGIAKILPLQTDTPKETATLQPPVGTNIQPMLERVFLALENGNFAQADSLCEKVLNIDPKCVQAYLGKLMAELRIRKQEELKDCEQSFEDNSNYQIIARLGDKELKDTINGYLVDIEKRERERLAEIARKKAEERAKRIKKIAIIATPIVCAVIAFIIVLNTVIIPNGRLQKTKDQLKNIKVGSYITFGIYEQDNDTSNGKEAIEWLVLEVTDGKALVISKYALDCQQYNTSDTDVTWETCTLRKWLNEEFVDAAFSSAEKAMISTVDQVFLLSIAEANEYFGTYRARRCEATAYAVANGAYVNSYNNCWWWLRSPGDYQGTAASVSSGGDVDEGGYGVDFDFYAVRPALWIDLNSLIFGSQIIVPSLAACPAANEGTCRPQPSPGGRLDARRAPLALPEGEARGALATPPLRRGKSVTVVGADIIRPKAFPWGKVAPPAGGDG